MLIARQWDGSRCLSGRAAGHWARVEPCRPARAMLIGSVGDNGERELNPGLVNGHELDGAAGRGIGRSFALAQANIPQGLDISEEIRQADETRAVGISQQFFDVAQHAPAIGNAGKDGAVAGQIEQALEHRGSRGAAGEGAEFVEDATDPDMHGQIRTAKGAKNAKVFRNFFQGSQAVDFSIGEGEGRRAQQADQGQFIGGIGDRSQDVEQVADFGAVVEAASGHGDEGIPACSKAFS